MRLAPIVLFVYNRPSHTKQTIEALLQNSLSSKSELFIYSDAPKNQESYSQVQEVRNYIHSIEGFAKITIIERETNFGLADSIIDGVTTIVNQYGKIIVLEDDIVVSPFFLEYMNTNLNIYQDDKNVACITAFNFPLDYPHDLPQQNTFFLIGADCWTWATWKRAWNIFESDGKKLLGQIQSNKLEESFNLENSYPYVKMLQDQIRGKNNSWAIRWYASAFLHNMFCLYPKFSLVENIGTDGTHFKNAKKDALFGQRSQESFKILKVPIQENQAFKNAIISFHNKRKRCLVSRILNKLRNIYNEIIS